MSPLPTARIAWFNGKYLPENEVFPGAGLEEWGWRD